MKAVRLAAVLLLAAATAAGQAPAPAAPQPPGTQLLLLRLSLRMDHIDQGYTLMTPAQRVEQIGAAEGLLQQLRGRHLEEGQQHAVFKYEMRLRALRQDLNGHP
jgi:hypothetical protein